jgi:hypothetical protein
MTMLTMRLALIARVFVRFDHVASVIVKEAFRCACG